MSIAIAVDENNDMYLTGNRLTMVTGLQAVLVACQTASKTLLGEMVLDAGNGLPYFQNLFGGAPNLAQFEAAFRARILAVGGVSSISSLVVTLRADIYAYTAEIVTIYGVGTLNG